MIGSTTLWAEGRLQLHQFPFSQCEPADLVIAAGASESRGFAEILSHVLGKMCVAAEGDRDVQAVRDSEKLFAWVNLLAGFAQAGGADFNRNVRFGDDA